ncbi:cytochrome P450 2U1-like [Physella acuta]|uniref:cytochrome P450 2U1-like n=1 Tax=Physella acuta TaxID=109671 RepID=UPI0027DB36C3|nr:cytochrome P450 2U1-like [Physella acuta]
MLEELLSTLPTWAWLVVVLISLVWWYNHKPAPPNYPPSPGLSLPLIGHLYLMEKDPRKNFRQWARTLGGAFSLKMGTAPFVVLNKYELIHEALVKQGDNFSNRSTIDFFSSQFPERTNGIALSSGPLWKEIRTASMTIMRYLGMGKNILADKISDVVEVYLQELSHLNGRATNVRNLTNACVANVICSIIFGKKFKMSDPTFNQLLHLNETLASTLSSTSLLNIFPFLKYIPFDPLNTKYVARIVTNIKLYTRELVNKCLEEHDPDCDDNFILCFVNEIKTKQEGRSHTLLDEEKLGVLVEDLLAAGTETTSTTIMWAMLYALHYPETQEKIYQEIVDSVGTNRSPTIYDKPNLKYLNAFTMEVQRITTIFPLALIHECSQDTTVGGYTIPKGTQVLPNLDFVHNDQQVWGDPGNFRPERFLDDHGDVISREELMPFSIGRRVCLGESLAKTELFLFLSALFQRFRLLPADPPHLPTLTGVFGLTVGPEGFEIRLAERETI